MFTTHEINEIEHKAWFLKNLGDPTTIWYIHTERDTNPDGVVGFTQYHREQRTAFWGFYLGFDAKKGSGLKLGIEGLNEAFGGLNLYKLNAEVLSSNNKSLSFHRKLGFEQEGCFKRDHFNGKEYIDVYRFGITSSIWEKRREELNNSLAENL
jgi:UDP-4-amino-4,6-dideoxy-N-acetyl-beta-L-altrosamine N-acetyltransferase